MKGLRLHLPPFASDIAGASSVFYALGGLVLVLDAGGCAGNVCADEPRWASSRSRIFSAGLRDMDAILGRDDLLIAKLDAALREVADADFVAIIGTPAPAIIGTDYRALTRLAAKVTDRPLLFVDSDGTRLYHEGAAKAFLALVRSFARPPSAVDGNRVGVLGVTPLDFTAARLGAVRRELGPASVVYAHDGRLADFAAAATVSRNVVVSAAGLPAAQWLRDNFRLPFTVACPLTAEEGAALSAAASPGGRALVIGEPVWARSAAAHLRQLSPRLDVVASTWFAAPGLALDVAFREEDEFIAHVSGGGYNVIIGDGVYRRALPRFDGRWVDVKHPAASGCEGLT